MNNKLISAASSYNIERSLNTPLVGKVALFHATQATKGFESGDMTRKMAETSRGATVRNVPGTRSEARRSERSVTLVTLGYQRRRRNMSEPSKGGCMASAVHEMWMGTFTTRDGSGSSGANAQRGTCAASPGPLGKGKCDMVV